MKIIKVDNITKSFKNHKAIVKTTFTIEKGKIYGFIGPNGAGKTTIIKMILGIIQPDSGTIEVFNIKDTMEINKVLSKIGVVLGPSYYGHLDAFDNMKMVSNMKGIDIDDEGIRNKLSLVGLPLEKKKKVRDFSMGMKQRLCIAESLLGNPELLIWDEPINGLDPQGVIEIRKLIQSLNKEKNITFLISSHILSELDKVISDVIVISNGEIKFSGAVSNLLEKYERTELEEAYLACLTGGIDD